MISIRPQELEPSYDAIVVGAGVGGMVCASFLREAGSSVLVVDHHYLPGGYCTAFRRGPYLFDAAVHHIGGAGRLGVVGRIQRRFDLDVQFVRLDPMDHMVFADLDIELDIPNDPDAYRAELQQRFPGDASGIESIFAALVRFYRQILRGAGDLFARYADATFAAFLADHVSDPALLRILGGQWGYLGLPAAQVSAVGMVQMLVSYLRDGAWYPLGSTQAFSDALARTLLERGAHVLLRHGVDSVLVDGHRAQGVRLADGREVRARVVISNADARQLVDDLLPDDVCMEERRQIEALVPSCSFFGFYIGFVGDEPPARLPRGFYYLDAGNAIEWIYLSIGTRHDPSLAPPGHQTLSATVCVSAGADEYEAWHADRTGLERTVLRVLEERAPGCLHRIEHLESATPRTMERYTLSKGGSAYGWAVSPSQAGSHRLSCETSLAGLYLTGQWTRPGPGVAAVAASGWATANTILRGSLS